MNSFFHSLSWNFLSKFIISVFNIILVIVLTRNLTPKDFGLFAIVISFIGFIEVFIDMGFSSYIIQKRKIHPVYLDTVFYINLLMSFLLFLLLIFSAHEIANFYNNVLLEKIIYFISFILIIKAFSSVQRALFIKELKFKDLSIINIFSVVISGAVAIVLSYRYGIWSLVFQFIIKELLFFILIWTKSKWRPHFRFSYKAFKIMFDFSSKIFIVSFLNAVFGRIDMLVFGKIMSSIELGFYERAKKLNQLIYSYSAEILGTVVFPFFSKIKDKRDFLKKFDYVYILLALFVFYMIPFVFIEAHDIILILFSEKWLKIEVFLKLIVLSLFYYIFSSFLTNIIMSRGKAKEYLKLDLIKKFFLLINILIGINYGLIVYLYFSILFSFIMFLFDLYFVSFILNISFKNYFIIFVRFLIKALFLTIVILIIKRYIFLENCITDFLLIGVIYSIMFVILNFFNIKQIILNKRILK